jgi:hypothetical protein
MTMNRKLYETIVALTNFAEEGSEKLAERVDVGPAERLAIAESQCAIIMGRYYVDEYEEQYRNDNLPES